MEVGELPPTDAISRISEKCNGNDHPNDLGLNNKETSSLTLKLKKINFDFQEQKNVSEDSKFYSNKEQKPLFIPLNVLHSEKGLLFFITYQYFNEKSNL